MWAISDSRSKESVGLRLLDVFACKGLRNLARSMIKLLLITVRQRSALYIRGFHRAKK